MPRDLKTHNDLLLQSVIDEIHQRLDNVVESLSWLVRGDMRFRKGQRVQFSAKAIQSGVARRKKGKLPKGTIVEIEGGFWISVKLDGASRPRSYHHTFFDPVGNQPKWPARGRRQQSAR